MGRYGVGGQEEQKISCFSVGQVHIKYWRLCKEGLMPSKDRTLVPSTGLPGSDQLITIYHPG